MVSIRAPVCGTIVDDASPCEGADETTWWEVKNELMKLRADCVTAAQLKEALGELIKDGGNSWANRCKDVPDDELEVIAYEACENQAPALVEAGKADYVINLDTGSFHKIGKDGPAVHPGSWITKCGWRFGFARYERRVKLVKQCCCLKAGCFKGEALDESSDSVLM